MLVLPPYELGLGDKGGDGHHKLCVHVEKCGELSEKCVWLFHDRSWPLAKVYEGSVFLSA